MKIIYQEESLDAVLKYFIEDFQTKEGERIVRHETFVDQIRGKIVFKLFVDDKKEVK